MEQGKNESVDEVFCPTEIVDFAELESFRGQTVEIETDGELSIRFVDLARILKFESFSTKQKVAKSLYPKSARYREVNGKLVQRRGNNLRAYRNEVLMALALKMLGKKDIPQLIEGKRNSHQTIRLLRDNGFTGEDFICELAPSQEWIQKAYLYTDKILKKYGTYFKEAKFQKGAPTQKKKVTLEDLFS